MAKKRGGNLSQTFPLRRGIRHRSREAQVPIYLGKFFRMFLYQNDWKVLPMAAVIAGLVSYVVRKDFFLNMEGTLKGAFALTCIAIWNGCFNSIQVICRERNIVKREHRSGMHISSYIAGHMIYQAFLCASQTALTLFVCSRAGIRFPEEGYVTPWFMLDIGITLFLIIYASDMLALFVSSVVHTTTAAMTIMPFILIFQLIFSGGVFSLPSWGEKLSNYTISKYGLACICAQADYNDLPMVTAWNTLKKMEDTDITLGKIMEVIGEDRVKEYVQTQAAKASQKPAYDKTYGNIVESWIELILYALIFAFLSMIMLKFIDKDKR